MAIAFVQQTGAANTTNAVAAAGFGSNVAAASLIVVIVYSVSETASVTVSDSFGSTYTQAGTYKTLSGTGRISLWYAANVTGGSCNVTVTLSLATSWVFDALEYSGVQTSAPLEASASASGTSSTPAAGTVTATATNLVVTAYGTQTGFVGVVVPSPFTTRVISGSTARFHLADDVNAAGNEGCTFNCLQSAGWVAFGASFLAAASPPPPPPPANIYRRREPGPPLIGMPWSVLLSPPPGLVQAIPPLPPMPSPPVPPVPPVPPGSPPVPPTLPPTLTTAATVSALAPDEAAPVMVRRFMQQWADEHNSLTTTGQLVKGEDGVYRLVVVASGLSGPIGDP